MTQVNNVLLNDRYEKIFDANLGGGTKRGTQSVIFRVTDLNDNYKKKAVKKIYIEGIDYKKVEEFEEIKLLRRLRHANVVKYFEDFSDSIFLYIVFEYCETGDLQNYLNINGKIEIYKGINWFNQLVLGLKYLHENKCIHGDVKPSNILIKKDVLKISNFGVSKLIKSLNLMVSKDIETIEFMSPEMHKGEICDFKTDIWSLGVVYYEMNTNELPFNGYVDSEKANFDEDKLKNEIYTKQMPQLPEEIRRFKFLNNLLIRMLEKHQKDRINIFIIYEELKEFSNEIIQKSNQDTQNSNDDPKELLRLINEWNSNHNDLFEISQPDNNNKFHGIIRFYYQDTDEKVSSKCILVDCNSRAENLISVLIEKFLPNMKTLLETPYKLLSENIFGIYEIHANSEHKLSNKENPLLIQLNWYKNEKRKEKGDGRFLFRNENYEKTLQYEDICNIIEKDDNLLSYKNLITTDINSISSISNPELRMAKCRQEKLEEKLKQIKMHDGGGTLKIYGDKINPDVPYKTLLMSNKDTAAFAVKETLEKYGLSNEDPINYCLVQVVSPNCVNKDNSYNTKEFVLEDDACPLANLIKHLPSSGSIIFQIRRCPPDILNKRKMEQQSKSQISHLKIVSSFLSQSPIDSSSTSISNSFTNILQKVPNHPVLPGLLEFSESNEDTLLIQISTSSNCSSSEFKLEPTYTMYMMLRYRLSDKYADHEFSENLSPLIHKMVDVIRKTINLNHLNQSVLCYWLANASEFLNILKSDRNLSKISQDAQETLIGCVQIAFYYLNNLIQKKLDFLLNEFINPYDDDESDNEIKLNDVNKDQSIKKLIKVLNESINLFRNSKVNNALIFQLFSHYFHYINAWLFNKLVTTNHNQYSLCTKSWGLVLQNFLEKIKLWTVKQGLELIFKKKFYKIIQAKILLETSKHDIKDLPMLSSKCFSLNSLQIASLIKNYHLEENELPISQQLANSLISAAKSNADEILKSKEKLIEIEEDFDLKDSLVVPKDGYSIDKVKGLPIELVDFIENLQNLELCSLLKNDDEVGGNRWTEFMTIIEDNKSISNFTNGLNEDLDSFEIRSVDVLEDSGESTTQNTNFDNSFLIQNLEIIKINLTKKNDSVGINIIGIEGRTQSGIYIKSLVKDSPAYLDGRLKKGDLIISINEYNLIGIGVEKAAELFNKCSSNICLTIGKKAAYLDRMNSSIRKKLGIKRKSKPLPSFS